MVRPMHSRSLSTKSIRSESSLLVSTAVAAAWLDSVGATSADRDAARVPRAPGSRHGPSTLPSSVSTFCNPDWCATSSSIVSFALSPRRAAVCRCGVCRCVWRMCRLCAAAAATALDAAGLATDRDDGSDGRLGQSSEAKGKREERKSTTSNHGNDR